jgi:LPXTG-motif cell wall-anchored protein
MRRTVALICAAAALVSASPAGAALFVRFLPHKALPGDAVVAEAPGLGIGIGASTRLFLVPPDVDPKSVKSPRDPRLILVGPLTDRPEGAGVTFLVPDLPDGTYSQAFLCPRCGQYSFGKTFFVLDPKDASPETMLRIGAGGGSASWYPWLGAVLVIGVALVWVARRRRPG